MFQVRVACGHPKRYAKRELSNADARPTGATVSTTTHAHKTRLAGTSLYVRIESLVHQLIRERTLFSEMADRVCNTIEGVTVHEPFGQNTCWTGDHFGQYTKVVVANGRKHEKDNPEVSDSADGPGAQTLRSLAARLDENSRTLSSLHVILFAKPERAEKPSADTYVVEGSGDTSRPGRKKPPIDDEDYNDNGSGEGSGDSSSGMTVQLSRS